MDYSTEHQVRYNSMPSNTNVRMDTARGYMVLRPDYTCGPNVKFIIGGTYHHTIHPCFEKRGFYFCKSLAGCFVCKSEFDVKSRIVEVESIGGYIENERLYAAHQIRVIRELTWEDALAELRSKQLPSRIPARTAQKPQTTDTACLTDSDSSKSGCSDRHTDNAARTLPTETSSSAQQKTQAFQTLLGMLACLSER